MRTFRVLFFTQGFYGDRIVENIKRLAPENWEILSLQIPKELPQIIEKPEEIVKGFKLSRVWDLIVFLGESPSAFMLLPSIVKETSASSVIAPVDDYSWLPLGLERQIRGELQSLGIGIAFPRPFCSLTSTGIGAIDKFAELFGAPKLEIVLSQNIIKSVKVVRGAPCGSTWYVAEKLPGNKAESAEHRVAILVQTYPCLASRRFERILSDAPIHVSARIISKSISDAIKNIDDE
ncbi:hypothetical protein KEJ21_02770 [Candidatus Bathyarchaeota archaeon]|nr:hypothetical protein [Candidatus Bathyarchaeota archaeon]MBS7629977.1 hypothetical protein [Candidatus Bathyarchaeota archaeon]